MSRPRKRPATPSYSSAHHVAQIATLLRNFEAELGSGDLRSKVQALIPIQEELDSLGISLIPAELAPAARDRILHYFRSYPKTVISRKEIRVVAGIEEWARRLRELRTDFGWPIINGLALKEMQDEGELRDLPTENMTADDYVLVADKQDLETAYRNALARDIRKMPLSVKGRILEFLRRNVGKNVSGEELRYVGGDATEWARRVRELRTEEGWPVVTHYNGRPDLPVGIYVLEADRQSPPHDRHIKDEVRRSVLVRDRYRCQRCGWSHDAWDKADPRHLELHHVEHHISGGKNSADNLITLCTVCHDAWHSIAGRDPSVNFRQWLLSRLS